MYDIPIIQANAVIGTVHNQVFSGPKKSGLNLPPYYNWLEFFLEEHFYRTFFYYFKIEELERSTYIKLLT
jgi:hypothetical protein